MIFHTTKHLKMECKENDFSFCQTAENVSEKLFSLKNYFSWKIIFREMIFTPTKHTLIKKCDGLICTFCSSIITLMDDSEEILVN